MKNIKSKFLSLTFAIIASLSLIVTSVAPAYAIEATSSTETETTTASETETTTETEEPEINSTLITIIARNSDDNTRISSALVSIKDNSGNTLPFVKTGDGEYQYSTSGTIKALETNSKGKIIISNLEKGTYTAVDAGTESTYICEGNNKFMISTLSDNLEVSLDYSLNVGSLCLTFLDGDDNSVIEKGRFVLKDSLGNLVDVTCISAGSYECSNSKSGAGEFITNSSGKVTVTKIPSGKYTVEEVYAPAKYNSGLVTASVTINAKEITNITVTNTKKYGDLNVKINSALDSSKLKGYVFKIANADGYAMPMYEASDNLFYYNRGGENTAVTVKSASDLSLVGLPEGSYTLHMDKGIDDYKKINDVSFKIEKGKVTTITLNPQRSVGSLSISKKDETTGKGLKNFKIQLLAADNSEMNFTKNESGYYEYTIEKNGINVLETDEDGKILVKGIPTGTIFVKEIAATEGYMFSREQVEQTISEDTETVYESTSKKSNCALEFVDKEGNPVEGISVKITDTNDKVVLESKSNANGYILMSNISAGKYVYEIVEVPSTYSLPQIKSEFSVDDKGIATGLEIITIDYSSISIEIAGISGNDASGFEFVLKDSNGKEYKLTSDKEGKVIFEKIPYGTYSITNTKAPEGYEKSEESFENILIDGKYSNATNKYTFNTKEIVIEETTSSESNEKNNNNGFTAIIVILVLILLAAIGGIIYVLIQSKKESSNKENKENGDTNNSENKKAEEKVEHKTEENTKPNQKQEKNESNKQKNDKTKKDSVKTEETSEVEPIIITEEPNEDIIIETTQEAIKEENIVIPEDVNDRKPSKASSTPIDPFNK